MLKISRQSLAALEEYAIAQRRGSLRKRILFKHPDCIEQNESECLEYKLDSILKLVLRYGIANAEAEMLLATLVFSDELGVGLTRYQEFLLERTGFDDNYRVSQYYQDKIDGSLINLMEFEDLQYLVQEP